MDCKSMSLPKKLTEEIDVHTDILYESTARDRTSKPAYTAWC